MMLIAEGIELLLLAGALLGPVPWIVLGLLTYAANTHSGDLAHEAAVGVASTEPPVTRFARPAKIVAFMIAGLLCLLAVSETISFLTRIGGLWAEVRMYATLGIYVVHFALLAVLVVILAAVFWDVRVGHKMAGRDAGVAYGVIAALHVLQLGGLVALVMSGAQMM